ncbi:putative type-1 restriction enzyme MjaXP specificity protein [alpha proteobacterium Q-1]|nr:putative type-1 restriction enzyme MjaXP specificity protein [alpha proteobacterium Q-1]
MKSDWQTQTIEEVCEVVNGGTPKTGVREYWDGGHQWVTPAEMGKRQSPFIAETARTLTDAGVANSSARPLPPMSVILSSRAPIGHLVINTVPMSFNQGCKGLIPKQNLHHKYLFYFLHANVELLNSLGTGATFKELSGGKLKSVQIPVPPLEEQKRIAAILDEAFEGIAKATANAERNLANSEELFDSQLQSIFDDQDGAEYELSDVCSIESRLIDPKAAEFADLLHIGGGNMVTKSDELIDLRTAKEEGLISGKFLFDRETVLYSKIRPYLMKVSRPDFMGLCSADVYPLKPRKGILDRDYLYFLLLSKRFTDYAVEGSGRAGMPKVNRKHLFAYRVRLPDLELQKEAAAKIDSTMNARSQLSKVYRSKLRALSQLRQTLLQKAFSGELTSANERRANVNAVAATTSPQYTADVLAFAFAKHRAAQRDRTFGRVKGQKVLHLVEAVAGVDLGRDPIKDAAGPNDSAHMRRAEDWAAQQGYFAFEARGTGGYDFKPGRNYQKTLASSYARLSAHKDEIAKVIDLVIPLDSQEAEVLATVHAAWNNLIIDGVEPTRNAIIAEARENWAASKLEIPAARFEEAIRFIRQNNIIPDGSAKAVRARQESLF